MLEMKTVKLLEQVVKCSFGSFIMYFLIYCLCQVLFKIDCEVAFYFIVESYCICTEGTVRRSTQVSLVRLGFSRVNQAPRAAPECDAGILVHLVTHLWAEGDARPELNTNNCSVSQPS